MTLLRTGKGLSSVDPVRAAAEIYGQRKSQIESVYKTCEELLLFLNANLVAQVQSIAPSSAYELMHESSFPVLKIDSRMVVPKEKFIEWVERNAGGDS